MNTLKKATFTFAGLLLALSVVYVGLYHGINFFLPWSTSFYLYLVLSVLFIGTLAAFALQLVILKRAPDYSIHIIIGAIIIRLFLFGAFNFVMIYMSKDLAVQNVVLFFASYLGFTFLELVVLLRQITSFKAS